MGIGRAAVTMARMARTMASNGTTIASTFLQLIGRSLAHMHGIQQLRTVRSPMAKSRYSSTLLREAASAPERQPLIVRTPACAACRPLRTPCELRREPSLWASWTKLFSATPWTQETAVELTEPSRGALQTTGVARVAVPCPGGINRDRAKRATRGRATFVARNGLGVRIPKGEYDQAPWGRTPESAPEMATHSCSRRVLRYIATHSCGWRYWSTIIGHCSCGWQ